jgi:hypothetical protein
MADAYPYEDEVRVKVCEWDRWRRGATGSPQSVEMHPDEAALKREMRMDAGIAIPTIAASAEVTGRTIALMRVQLREQCVALLHYHLQSVSNIDIARKLECSRNRVPDILTLGHENFIAIRKQQTR